MLDNIFEPLFNASDNPENEQSVEINKFLLNVNSDRYFLLKRIYIINLRNKKAKIQKDFIIIF